MSRTERRYSSSSSVDMSEQRFLQITRIEPPNFVKVWDDHGTCFKPNDCTVWSPKPPEGFWILGDVMERGQHDQPRETISVGVRDPNPGIDPPLIKPPEGYELLWNTKGTGAKHGQLSMWRPKAPEGYVACGTVITQSEKLAPPEAGRTNIACILEEAAAEAKAQPETDGVYLWGTSKNFFRTIGLKMLNTNPDHKYCAVWNLKASTPEGINCGTFHVTDLQPKLKDRVGLYCVADPSSTPIPIDSGYRYKSFVPERREVNCRWFVDGESYYETVADALETAESEIFIAGWCVSPELFLRRRQPISVEDRLDKILLKMAKKGVSVFVLLWWDTEMTVGGTVNSAHAMRTLEALHENVRVIRHPGGRGKIMWTHHQKFVVIDQQVAFVGGIDMCFGRYDTQEHKLTDNCHMNLRFPGKDYYQPRVLDFQDLERPFDDLVDRTTVPRMPWHDIHSQVDRDAARDLAINFIQRWNHHLKKKVGTSYRDYPPLTPASSPFSTSLPRGTCNTQILRSMGTWSMGLPENAIEKSIHTCYLDIIRNAQHFIYIENQYFISVKNTVADAIFERICQAIENQETFRVIILIPITPCGSWETSTIRCVMKWQYDTISRGGHSIRERISTRYPSVKVDDYIGFFSLRNIAILNDQIVADQIYIHSKLIIVDDRIALIGTANVNDRSMSGDRDSEIAVIVEDTHYVESKMNGKFFLAAKFAHTLRVNLFLEHLGLDESDKHLVVDPIHDSTFSRLWWTTARTNQRMFSDILLTTPCDTLTRISDVTALQAGLDARTPEELYRDKDRNLQRMSAIKGHLVSYPLDFLKEEKLDDAGIEGLLPAWVYQ